MKTSTNTKWNEYIMKSIRYNYKYLQGTPSVKSFRREENEPALLKLKAEQLIRIHIATIRDRY